MKREKNRFVTLGVIFSPFLWYIVTSNWYIARSSEDIQAGEKILRWAWCLLLPLSLIAGLVSKRTRLIIIKSVFGYLLLIFLANVSIFPYIDLVIVRIVSDFISCKPPVYSRHFEQIHN